MRTLKLLLLVCTVLMGHNCSSNADTEVDRLIKEERQKMAGTWHWMFNGRGFATMSLVRTESGFVSVRSPKMVLVLFRKRFEFVLLVAEEDL